MERETCPGLKNVLWETAQTFTGRLAGRRLGLRGCPGLKEHLKGFKPRRGWWGEQWRQTGHERSGRWKRRESQLLWERLRFVFPQLELKIIRLLLVWIKNKNDA